MPSKLATVVVALSVSLLAAAPAARGVLRRVRAERRELPARCERQGRADRRRRRRPPWRGPRRRRPAGRRRARHGRAPGARRNAAAAKEIVILGTLGRSPLVDELVAAGKLDVRGDRRPVGDVARAGGGEPAAGRAPRVRDRRQRPAGHDLRRLRRLGADRRLALALLGRRPGAPPRRALRAARPPHPGHAEGQVPRLLHQRREPGARPLGAAYFGPGSPRASPTASTTSSTPRSSRRCCG